MLDALNKYSLVKGTKAFGVELIFIAKDNYVLNAIELAQQKDKLEIVHRMENTSFAEIANLNTKRLPVYLSIDGRGVINKKLLVNEHSGDQELINQLLPNATLKDFYLQRTIVSDHENWVSIIRKEILDGIIEEIEKNHLFCVQLTIGAFTIENILSFINESEVKTSYHKIRIENHKIVDISALKEEDLTSHQYHIENDQLSSNELVPFANAFSHFVPSEHILPFNNTKIEHLNKEYYNRSKYITVGFSMLVFFLAITLTNMLLFNHYQQKNNELQAQINSKQQFVTELGQLKEEVKIKEEFVQHSGLTQASKTSFYTDQIALGIPTSIQLNQLFINPLLKRVRKAEDINYNFNKIILSGTVNKSIELNTWVKELKAYDWVSEVLIVSFLQDNLRTSGDFELEISIKD